MTSLWVAAEERLLRWLRPPADIIARPYRPHGGEYSSMLTRHFGAPLFDAIQGRVVIDYGCGEGPDAIALAQHGAKRVIGLDMDPRYLRRARERAEAAGVSDRCTFTTQAEEMADIIVSSDVFEHTSDLAETLRDMDRRLNPGGAVWAAFGPPWYHPRGGHIFAVFPWAHLILSEAALCRWRSASSQVAVRRFADVGLNQMSVGRFLRIVADSPFRLDAFRLIPIQRIRRLGLERWGLTREFATSVVTCRLKRRS